MFGFIPHAPYLCVVEFSAVWKSWHTIGAHFYAVHSPVGVGANDLGNPPGRLRKENK
jgi:hypothetical protein